MSAFGEAAGRATGRQPQSRCQVWRKRVRDAANLAAVRREFPGKRSVACVGFQIVSCDLAHTAPDTGRVRFSRSFVGEPGSPASLRHLAPCLGGTSGIDADACLARIISFWQEPPSGPVWPDTTSECAKHPPGVGLGQPSGHLTFPPPRLPAHLPSRPRTGPFR